MAPEAGGVDPRQVELARLSCAAWNDYLEQQLGLLARSPQPDKGLIADLTAIRDLLGLLEGLLAAVAQVHPSQDPPASH